MIVSIVSSSASVSTALPQVKDVPVRVPPDVTAPVKLAVEPPTTAPVISTASLILMLAESVDCIMLQSIVPTVTVSPSKFATSVAVLESVTAVADAAEVVNTALNLSSPSFQYRAALFPADPRWMYIPASSSAPPELSLFNSIKLSPISNVVAFISVVVPLLLD